jgi:hypothetical protein
MLPDELEQEYNSIDNEFKAMLESYRPNVDAFITEDKKFTRRIIKFIINVIDYILQNYEEINVLEYQEFLGYYHFNFIYGPNGDDMNYLDSDENVIDEKQLQEFCFELRDEDFQVSTKKLEEIRARYFQLFEKI